MCVTSFVVFLSFELPFFVLCQGRAYFRYVRVSLIIFALSLVNIVANSIDLSLFSFVADASASSTPFNLVDLFYQEEQKITVLEKCENWESLVVDKQICAGEFCFPASPIETARRVVYSSAINLCS